MRWPKKLLASPSSAKKLARDSFEDLILLLRNELILMRHAQARNNSVCAPYFPLVKRAINSICSTRLNDRFPLQDSANCLIRIESASCCGANDRSNGSEKIGAPV